MQMRACPACGEIQPDGYNSCTNCGQSMVIDTSGGCCEAQEARDSFFADMERRSLKLSDILEQTGLTEDEFAVQYAEAGGIELTPAYKEYLLAQSDGPVIDELSDTDQSNPVDNSSESWYGIFANPNFDADHDYTMN